MTPSDSAIDTFRSIWVALAIVNGMCPAAAIIQHQMYCERGWL